MQDAQGVIPGAVVKITNVATNVVQPVVTNTSGYFEVPLLIAGGYQVNVEMAGFKTLSRTGITLAGGQHVALQLTLEIGTIEETVTVTGDAPLLEVTTTRIGTNFTERQIQNLPTMSNMPVMLARFAPGVAARPVVEMAGQGAIDVPSETAAPLGGVGGNEWSIDGATNNGSDRDFATSPNTDMIQEMRIESTSFSASVGHGTGIGIAMMTKPGTNTWHGTGNFQYWTNKFNPPTTFQKQAFDVNPEAKTVYEQGYSHNSSGTIGGPIRRNKLFVFMNYSYSSDNINGRNAPLRTIPASDKQLAGDFSDLLLLPRGAQYQIYDPLTTRPDPTRPGHVIRDPFPGNIIPADRITNPLYKTYTGFLPKPNNNPTSPDQEPLNNYYPAGQPVPLRAHVWGGRLDYNHSANNRFFFRNGGSYFTSRINDWTYLSAPGLHSLDRIRTTTSNTGTWTRVLGQTVIDGQLSYNRYKEHNRQLGLKAYTPSSVGLPSYMDDFCNARGDFGGVPSCSLPLMTITGYSAISTNSGTYDQVKNYQGQVNLSHVAGAHTLKAGTDIRMHDRVRNNPGTVSGNFTFDNTYTRRADDTTVFPAGNFGLSWAAFMLGMPTTVTNQFTSQYHATSPWVGTFVQDTWRLSSKLSVDRRRPVRVRERHHGGERRDGGGLRSDDDTGHHPAGRSGVCGCAHSATCTEHIQGARWPDLRLRRWDELGRTVDVDAARVRRLQPDRQDGLEGWLRHVLRHAECHGVYSAPDRVLTEHDEHFERGLWPDIPARRPEEGHFADARSVSPSRPTVSDSSRCSATRLA